MFWLDWMGISDQTQTKPTSDENLLEIILSLSGKETIQEQYKKSFLLILSQCVISIRTKSDHYLL